MHGLIALSWLVPFQVTMIPNYMRASRLGFLGTLPGLIIPRRHGRNRVVWSERRKPADA